MIAPSHAEVAAALRVLAAWFESQASNADAPAPRAEWIDQKASPLGRRRHINAVRRLVAEGADGARVVGRRYLLSANAIDAELGRVTRNAPVRSTPPAPVVDELAELRARYADATNAAKRGRAA